MYIKLHATFGITYLQMLERKSLEIPVLASALGSYPEHHGQTLLMQKPHTFFTGHRGIKLILDRKPPQCWLAFIVSECTMQIVRKKPSAIIPSYEPRDVH